jgi:hypothetical protein
MLTETVTRFCRNSALHQRISNDDHQVNITAITHIVKHLDIVQVIITATIHTVQHMDIVLQVQAGAPVMALPPFGAPSDERVGIFANAKGLVLDCLRYIHVNVVNLRVVTLNYQLEIVLTFHFERVQCVLHVLRFPGLLLLHFRILTLYIVLL